MRILLLEDEEAIRGFVRINLKRNGMEVIEAEDGETALALAEPASPPFDVALLDVMLPTISGFEVCEQLRARFPRMGIIMLTAKSQEEDKIRGLELGADDYVQKPFSPGELIARLNSLNRRMMPGGLSSQAEGTQEVAVKSSQTQARDSHTAGLRDAAETVNDEGLRSDNQQAAASYSGQQHVSSNRYPYPGGQLSDTSEPRGDDSLSRNDRATSGDSVSRDGRATSDDSASRSMNASGNDAITAAGGSAQAHPACSMAPIAPNASPLRALPRELSSGPFRLSAAERRLWKQGAEIVLTPTEWTLVELLMKRAGEGLSRDAILDAVWGRHFIGDLKIVDVNIRRIRQKLEDEPSEPQYIETLWGFGYRWKRSEAT
jgi:DNA-binding response OmpR family regulator